MQGLWRVHPDARLRMRHWGDESVVYHGASGSTHRLALPVGEMLELLQSVQATPEQISERIDLDRGDVDQVLQEMLRLGIAERL
ncbi:HPr-rel-A system PqqD family peptide chaperone [Pseudorhodoferax sp. Leaf274]|uniref:HPr-rel-A system PqqD family peptide chaperone n=1 Tax=Pseudorhodoferax sp. Leaf274 TaxID=1736318 RepID=UPI0012E2342B|nr:HPr-rel-A system PqqD family peptide chaperone [Pseudorhodoferax sp. Leaf274]